MNLFDNLTEKEAKERIISEFREYFERFHNSHDSFTPGDPIKYAGRVYGAEEVENLIDASLEFWLTSGAWTDRFEKDFGKYLNIPYVSLVNSGSSANLLAFMALTSSELEGRAIERGDEVITLACGFPTTIAPIIQYGAIPVFIDVNLPNAEPDTSYLEDALSDKTKAVIFAHTLGNPFDLKTVKDFCSKHNLWLIEDNCDSLGSRYKIGDTWYMTGTVGDIGTSSFYPPHHMTMGEGGAVYTKNPLLHRIIRSLRDWGRDCVCPSGIDNTCGHRFDGQFGLLPKGYDHKYVYSHFGYNLKATDLQASIGCAQLQRMPQFVEQRKENFELLHRQLAVAEDKIFLPYATANSDPSWFGFLITCKDNLDRNLIVDFLEKHNIQTRMLFAGNIVCHPCFDKMRESQSGYRIIGELNNTDFIMRNSFWVGVYPGMSEDMLRFMSESILGAVC